MLPSSTQQNLFVKRKILLLCFSLLFFVGIGILFRSAQTEDIKQQRQPYETVLSTQTPKQYRMTKTPASDLTLTTKKENFLAEERPTFKVRIGGGLGNNSSSTEQSEWRSLSESGDTVLDFARTIKKHLSQSITAHADEPIDVPQMEITFQRTTEKEKFLPGEIVGMENGEVEIAPIRTAAFKPGKYTLVVNSGDRNITQDFYWGVLAVNTNKSVYTSGETAQIGMAVLDDFGRTKCINGDTDFMIGKVWLKITAPDGSREELSTENKKVLGSDECYDRSVTNKADFLTSYKTKGPGRYQMHLEGENQNGKRSIDDYFEVQDDAPFVIERTSLPTRTYPSSNYTHTFTVTAKQNFTGEIIERTPAVYKILDCGGCQVLGKDIEFDPQDPEQRQQLHVLVWKVNMQKGETKTFMYTNDPPNVSPEFFLMGPVGVYEDSGQARMTDTSGLVFEEARQWQVASDAVRTWDGGDVVNQDWNDATNWSSDTLCGSTDVCTFDNTSDENADINVSITPDGIDINSGYDGTITQQSTNTIATDTTSGFAQSSGTFTGGSGAQTYTDGSFVVDGGTHTTTTGAIIVDRDFTISSTFTNSASSITFRGSASDPSDDTTVTCSTNIGSNFVLTKIYSAGTADASQQRFTNGSGCTLSFTTVSGTTSMGNFTNQGTLTIQNGAGTMTVSDGDISNSGTLTNNATIVATRNFDNTGGTLVNSSGTITFSGSASDASDDTTFTCNNSPGGTFNLSKVYSAGSADASQQRFSLSSSCTIAIASVSGTTGIGNISNAGTLTFTSGGGTLSSTDGDFTNTGTLTNQITINIEKNFNSTGGSITNSSGTINFVDSASDTTDDSTFTCENTVGGTVGFNKDYAGVGNSITIADGGADCVITGATAIAGSAVDAFSNAGTLTFGGGNALLMLANSTNTGALTNNGTMNFEKNFNSTGGSINNSGGTINFVDSASDTTDDSTFTCESTVGGTVGFNKDYAGVGNSITIADGGADCVITGATAIAGSAVDAFSNAGTLTFGGGNALLMLANSTNTGALTNNGTIEFEKNFNSTGGSINNSGGTINFVDSGSDSTDDSTFTCESTVGGTVGFNKDYAGVGNSITIADGGADCVITGATAITSNAIDVLTTAGTVTFGGGTALTLIGNSTNSFTNTGTFTNNGTINVERNFTDSGTIVSGSGTWQFTESAADTSDDNTWTCGASSNLGAVTINKPANSNTVVLGSNCTVGTFTRTTGLISNPGSAYTLTVQGNLSLSSTTNIGGANMTISMGGSATQTINFAATSTTFVSKFDVNKSGGAANLITNNLVVTGQVCTITEGTFDLDGRNFTCSTGYTVQDGGNFQLYGTVETYTSPTLNTGSKVTFTGDGDSAADAITIPNLAYYHLSIISTDGSSDTYTLGSSPTSLGGNVVITGGTVKFNAGTTYTIGGTFTSTGTGVDQAIVRSSSNGSKWYIIVATLSSGSYSTITDSGCGANTRDILLNATNINGGNNEPCWRFANNATRMKGTSRVKGNVRLK